MVLMTTGGETAQSSIIQNLLQTKGTLVQVLQTQDVSLLWTFHASKQMQSLTRDPWNPSPIHIAYMPSLPTEGVLQPGSLKAQLRTYTETLTGAVLRIGGIIPIHFGKQPVAQNGQLVMGLVELGLGYAGSGNGSVAALHGHKRAVVSLDQPIVHPKLFSRRKECLRSLRKGKREQQAPLSFRCNSNFDVALAALRAHHEASGTCWVDEHIEAVWRWQRAQKRFVVLEIWQDTELLAADFCHLIPGGSIYVATRYFNRAKGFYSPGFLMALVSLQLLKQAGFHLWDLGQTDFNPLMAYKDVVSHVSPRPSKPQKSFWFSFFIFFFF
jgi:hypothetical protein